MSRANSELTVDELTGHVRPRRRPIVPDGALPRTPDEFIAATGATALLLFMFSLVIPATFQVAGINLPLYRIVLIFLLWPLVRRFLEEREQPINAVDVLVAGYIFWTALSVFANHGMSRFIYIGSTGIDQFGAYLVGRMLVRNLTDYRLFIKYFLWGLLFLFPFAVIEMATGRGLLNEFIGKFANTESTTGGTRMGLKRINAVFPHAILFGLWCGIGVANFYYAFYRGAFFRRWGAVSLSSLMVLMSLSTGPLLALVVQISLIIWNETTRWLRARWVVFIIVVALAVALIEVLVPQGLVGLVMDEIAYSGVSAWARFEIYEYGLMEVARNPMFGIGFNEWIRPWWRKTSVDTFWLGQAMRFGLPSLLFLLTALALHFVRIMTTSDVETRELRCGYLFAWAGLVLAIAAVNLWGAPSVFIMTYLGAGVWFYARRDPVVVLEARSRHLSDGGSPSAVPAGSIGSLRQTVGRGAARSGSGQVER